jgi:hypothetical protein
MTAANNQLILNSPVEIEGAFARVINRLNLSGYRVAIGNDRYSLDAATHQQVFLPRLALRAEELSVLILGVRLFEGVAYTVKKDTASGFQLQEVVSLSEQQRQDPNYLMTQSIPVATHETLTRALKGLILEQAVVECFDVDPENQLLHARAVEMEIHKVFKITVNYEEGQCIPLLPSEYLSANELQAMVISNVPLKALNKARRIAEEMAIERLGRHQREMSDSLDKGI